MFDYVEALFFKYHDVSLNCVGPYIDSPEWIKCNNNLKKGYDNCFKYAITAAINYRNIGKHSEKVSKIRSISIDQYEWKEMNFPAEVKYWKSFN